jgi:hypothetical protein
LTCISSWYICKPNIIWIHLTITEKMNGNCHYQECDGRTENRKTSSYHNTSRFQRAYKNYSNICGILQKQPFQLKFRRSQHPTIITNSYLKLCIWNGIKLCIF